MFRSITFLLA